MEAAGLDPGATQLVFVGGDAMQVTRALPRVKALDPDTIVAYGQNGDTLRPENGFPVRLLVPDWVGVANIKALKQVIAVSSLDDLDTLTRERLASYQTAQYVYVGPAYPDKPPAILQTVKAVIAHPGPDEKAPPGPYTVSGFAWSGSGHIRLVEVSIDGGNFEAATLGVQVDHGWVHWQLPWVATSGSHTFKARATDSAGNSQPTAEQVKFNALGYGYNGIMTAALNVK
ncbi:MAG: hypothetical protein NVSMB17_06900 [Candidatus Dormibacteria bacterium]